MFWLNLVQAQSFMPTPATEIAHRVDNLYSFLLISSFIACVILIGGMIYFVLKYKRKSENDKTPRITHNNFLEFLSLSYQLYIMLDFPDIKCNILFLN